jgi:hypothetical protein
MWGGLEETPRIALVVGRDVREALPAWNQIEDEDEDESDSALVTPPTARMPEHHPRRGRRDRSSSRSRKLSRDNA